MVIPLVSSHVQALGGNHVYVGLMGSMYSGFQLGSGPLIGSLSDLKGRKNILIATLLISSISYTSMGLTSSITVILITRAVLGLFKQTQVLTRALVPDYEKNENKQSIIYGLVYLLPNTNSVRREPTRVTNISSSILQKLVSSCKESIIELCKIEWSKYWDVFFFKGIALHRIAKGAAAISRTILAVYAAGTGYCNCNNMQCRVHYLSDAVASVPALNAGPARFRFAIGRYSTGKWILKANP
ncbi:hypothetical protein MSG28_002774 [Choristoneura fumiferana]|uniref:Uncharacterized protein n=1 Tax=Choristoneura fumiferana TaxID=7141 RepID=A0ACC0JJ61_CHOFU|nr:hypothetical protein MSG28_002774 [Choristoneura fumiferana]